MSPAEVLKLIKEKGVKFVDLRFTDTRGKEQHVTVPHHQVDAGMFEDGKMFDGSSIAGWKGINESDMILGLDPSTAVLDPFMEETTLNIRCDIIEPSTMQGYERDPRSAAKRAEAYMRSTGIADEAFFGPENEFFIFDDVRWASQMHTAFYAIDSYEGAWQSGKEIEEGNLGHRPGIKGGYFPVPPVDSLQDIRSAMCLALEEMGMVVEVHHHEVATAGQCEIGVKFGSLVKKADDVMMLKYVVHNVAHSFGKTATFMPKPLVGDNGSGMHVHQSLAKGGKNLFTGDLYGGLSQTALYYIGGIMKHAHALNALTNASTNSYKRLVKGFEAPDAARLLRAQPLGLDAHSVHAEPERASRRGAFPGQHGEPVSRVHGDADGRSRRHREQDQSGPAERQGSLRLAAGRGEADSDGVVLADAVARSPRQGSRLLDGGGVLNDSTIDAYIALKEQEITRFSMTPHPVEFEMYYSL